MVAPRRTALAEESAEVEVLFANMDKLKGLTKKIQASLNRLEASGRSVQAAVGPIYGNTQKLQATNSNIDRIIDAIERVREPLDQRDREERIIRSGPLIIGLDDYIASLDRTAQALGNLKHSNLRSNQQAISELKSLLKTGTTQLENLFRDVLRGETQAIEPLHHLTKGIPFPLLSEDTLSRLRLINNHVVASLAQASQNDVQDVLTAKAYAEVRGDYLNATLRGLSAASISTARKTVADAIYRQGTNGIGIYAKGLHGLYITEYNNICRVFAREDWGRVYGSTRQSSMDEFARTLRELNTHIRGNLMTDCFLAYEIIDIVTNLALELNSRTGEPKQPIAEALKPIRDTAKLSLPKLLENTRDRIQALAALPQDGAALPITAETMRRLQEMTGYLTPLTSIMTSLGDGGWSAGAAAASSDSVPTLKSFDVGADGRQLFAHYASDNIDTLITNLDLKGRTLLKARGVQGLFMANNAAVVERMIRSSDLQPLVSSVVNKVESWRAKGQSLYLEAWNEPSKHLLDVQYTKRNDPRPRSGNVDSAAIVKSLGSKDKDAIKEKFRNFNTSFDEMVAKHKSYKMEPEVREFLARKVQAQIEPLYGRFWDRYHEIDKGKGKHVKYDKSQLAVILASLS